MSLKVKKWQPIETAPQDGTYVLYFSPDRGQWVGNQPPNCDAGEWHFRKGEWFGVVSTCSDPTHWKQLSENPS